MPAQSIASPVTLGNLPKSIQIDFLDIKKKSGFLSLRRMLVMVSQLTVDPTYQKELVLFQWLQVPMEKVLERCTVRERKQGKDTLGEMGAAKSKDWYMVFI